MTRAGVTLATLMAAGLAQAEPAAVRVGDHPGFGRIVFDFPTPTAFEVAEQGGRVLLVFAGTPDVATPAAAPRNVLSVTGGSGAATLVLAPGARLRPVRMGNRVVVDVLDPATPAARRALPSVPAPAPVPVPVRQTPLPPEPAPAPAPPLPVVADPPAPPVPAPAPVVAGPLRVAAETGTGAAAFRRGETGVVVFDRSVDLAEATLRGVAGFEAASARSVAGSTVLLVPLPPGGGLRLTRDSGAWMVASAADGGTSGLSLVPAAAGISIPFEQPGRVVAIRDPLTGQGLLVGTLNPASGSAPGVRESRNAPGYALAPTWTGIVAEPMSDLVELRAGTAGFTLATPDATAVAQPAAPPPTRRFGFQPATTASLSRRLAAELAGAAMLPPRARGPQRVAAATTMIALGMGAEAQALLTLAAADDPAVADDPVAAGLGAVAALLAARPDEAGALDDARLDGTDEIALWRGIRNAARGKPAPASPATLALALAFPDAVRDRVLPEIAEQAVRDGVALPADDVLPGAGPLAFARAMQQERRNETEAALTAYDAMAVGRNRSDGVKAGVRAVELRVAAGRLAPAQAADAMERHAMAWRGDGRELAARLRAAELRTQAGAWRAALDYLRDTEAAFPDEKAAAAQRKAGVFHAMLAQPSSALPALDVVSIATDYADCVPDGPDGVLLAGALADKLLALDLPFRAAPVLDKLMRTAASGPVRAGFGLRLAQLRLDGGDATAAEAVLAGSGAPDLPTTTAEPRALLAARIRAARNDLPGAISGLLALRTEAADELRAALLAKSGDWAGSLAALNDLAAKSVPADGPLSDRQQEIALRQAGAAAQAGDAAALDAIRKHESRITGPRADLFRMLTARPVRSIADLPRAGSEIALARAVPDRLQALSRR